jgi:hypothetical protein
MGRRDADGMDEALGWSTADEALDPNIGTFRFYGSCSKSREPTSGLENR